jgi:hypothetical protein
MLLMAFLFLPQIRALQRKFFDTRVMNTLLQRVRENNDLGGRDLQKSFVPFKFEGDTFGYVSKQLAEDLGAQKYGNGVFELSGSPELPALTFTSQLHSATMEERTAAVGKVTAELREHAVVKGWRDELLPVSNAFSAAPICLIERAAYPLFGIKGT